MGVISRGAFLTAGAGQVLFVSAEDWRGPLTLNCPGNREAVSSLPLRASARLEGSGIAFPELGLQISTGEALVWKPPKPDAMLPLERRRERVAAVSGRLLPAGTGIDEFEETGLQPLIQAIEANHPGEAARLAETFLGRGPGLTPSGDDLLIGLLLALNRYNTFSTARPAVEELNERVCQAARQRTTTLSASLIECAAQGEADERLVLALDGMAAGTLDPVACAGLLRKWGSTSGVAAFQGMAQVLTRL